MFSWDCTKASCARDKVSCYTFPEYFNFSVLFPPKFIKGQQHHRVIFFFMAKLECLSTFFSYIVVIRPHYTSFVF